MIGELKNEVVVTLVLLERKFPPSFFDIMTHLLVHLVEELEKAFGFCTEYLVDFTTIRRQVWMTKKTLPCLMKCLKVVGIHES